MIENAMMAAEARSAARINIFRFLHDQGATFEQLQPLSTKISLFPQPGLESWMSEAVYLTKTRVGVLKSLADPSGFTARFKTDDERGVERDHYLHVRDRAPVLRVSKKGVITLDSGIANASKDIRAASYPKQKLIRYHIPEDIVPPGVKPGEKITVKKGVMVDVPYELQSELGMDLMSDTVFIVTQAEVVKF